MIIWSLFLELTSLIDHLESESKKNDEKHLKRIAELTKEKEDLYNMCDKLKKVKIWKSVLEIYGKIIESNIFFKELKVAIDSRLSVEQNYLNICQELK